MKEIGCVLLMGGKSSRMGTDKAYLLYEGICFWKRITDEMSACGPTYVSVDTIERAPDMEYPLILDEYEKIGPIGGIYSALRTVREELVFFAPCDIPTLSKNLIVGLMEEYQEEYDGVILSSKEGKIYPTIGIYSKRLLPKIEKHIVSQNYRLMNLIKQCNFKIVSMEQLNLGEDDLTNVNTQAEYHALKNN